MLAVILATGSTDRARSSIRDEHPSEGMSQSSHLPRLSVTAPSVHHQLDDDGHIEGAISRINSIEGIRRGSGHKVKFAVGPEEEHAVSSSSPSHAGGLHGPYGMLESERHDIAGGLHGPNGMLEAEGHDMADMPLSMRSPAPSDDEDMFWRQRKESSAANARDAAVRTEATVRRSLPKPRRALSVDNDSTISPNSSPPLRAVRPSLESAIPMANLKQHTRRPYSLYDDATSEDYSSSDDEGTRAVLRGGQRDSSREKPNENKDRKGKKETQKQVPP